LYFENGEWHRPSMEDLEIPQGIQVAVESRISKLPIEHQEVLRMASVLGREFDFDILLEALEVDENDLIEALESAEEAQLIHEADGHGEVTFAFVHALVPSAIVESVRRLRRRRLHKKAAQAIERLHPQDYETLAYHFSEAGDEARAYKYYISAGERSAKAFANADAEEQFLAALDLEESERDEAYLLSQIGIAQANQSRFSEARGTWQQAIELYRGLGDLDKVAELYARSGRAAWDGGDTKLDLSLCRHGLDVVEGTPEGPGLARLLAETSRACYFSGLHEDTERYGKRSLQIAEKLNLIAIQIETLTTIGNLPKLSLGESFKLLEKAVDLAESNQLLRQAMRAHNNLGVQYFLTSVDYPNAVKHCQRGLDIAHQVGDLEKELFFKVILCWRCLVQGMLNKVVEEIHSLQDLMESIPDPGAGGSGLEELKAGMLCYQGDLERAQEVLLERYQIELEAGNLQSIWELLGGNFLGLAEIYFIKGDVVRGKAAAEEMIRLAHQGMGIKSISYSFLSRFYSQGGETRKASEILEQARKETENSKYEFLDRWFCLWAQAYLNTAEENWESAFSSYGDLIDLLNSKNFRWHKTRALVEWAQAHLHRGQPGDRENAHQILGEAMDEFEDMGADGFVKMVADQLAELEGST
jgi:predicted ATPase